ncbi:uncharacterized protein METZ01_LOCUS487136, partial [marine metagenome]
MHIKPASRHTLNPNIFDIHKNNGECEVLYFIIEKEPV